MTQSKLWAALKQAQESVRSMEKSARNEFSKYDYVPHDAVIAEGRRALNRAGLVLAVTQARVEGDDLHLELVLAHESGESTVMSRSMPIVAGKTPRDKATGAADTYALSYAVRGLLAMDRMGDPSPDERDDSEHQAKPKPKPAAKQPAKARAADDADEVRRRFDEMQQVLKEVGLKTMPKPKGINEAKLLMKEATQRIDEAMGRKGAA